MDLFPTISVQMKAVGEPLYAVTVTAAARVNTPVLLMLHWHGFRRATPLRLPGIPIPTRAVPGSAIQINEQWQAFESIDQALLDAAWQLGAWDLERLQRRSCNEIGASAHEALACRQAFGDYADDRSGQAQLVDEAPDRKGLMQLGAAKGYLRWTFRPVKGGLWREAASDDDTLEADGGRQLPCPITARPLKDAPVSRNVYRLGWLERVILL
jgi:hypothetical protein